MASFFPRQSKLSIKMGTYGLTSTIIRCVVLPLLPLLYANLGCSHGDNSREWSCVSVAETPDYLSEIGCEADFDTLASTPLDASIPGARSVKTVLDRYDESQLYFQNSQLYPIHWDFTSTHLSGGSLPLVPMLSEFNASQYSSVSRRFLLGALTHYEALGVYVYEIAPYDLASADMILEAFRAIQNATYFGDDLRFYASSVAIENVVGSIAEEVNLITTTELFAGIDYQPLNIAECYGQLRFAESELLHEDYLSFRSVVVLDKVPNDISVVSGIITEQFQTPLSHINVLSRNRGTPNMALRGAFHDDTLRALEGKWVRLSVEANSYAIEETSIEEANAWWDEHKPTEVLVPGVDATITDLRDIENAVNMDTSDLKDAIKTATRAFGGKAAHYGAISHIENITVPKAFAIPVHYYLQFMEKNGFNERIETFLEDPSFIADPAVRDATLASLRLEMRATPLEAAFEAELVGKLSTQYPGLRMRFRSSTNAEDLDGFTGAGLYTSQSGDPLDANRPVADAVREVWSSVWYFRAFEERSYRSIDHMAVAMALLVHRSFPEEEANGVALTNNPFDPSGLDPAFYINVQQGDTSVVLPPEGTTADSLLYYFDRTDQPVTYFSHSNLTPNLEPVLNRAQLYDLGSSLANIRSFFASAYGSANAWWAMDVEFKFDGPGGQEPELFIKQARPYQ